MTTTSNAPCTADRADRGCSCTTQPTSKASATANVCSGRASKRKNCTRRAGPIGVAEQLVVDCYRDIAITKDEYTALATQVETAFDERLASRPQELTENRQRLQNKPDKLLSAHFADSIDLDT